MPVATNEDSSYLQNPASVLQSAPRDGHWVVCWWIYRVEDEVVRGKSTNDRLHGSLLGLGKLITIRTVPLPQEKCSCWLLVS